MLEKQLSEILAENLSKFIRDLNEEQLQVSLWSGELTLRNVQLQPNILEEISLLLFKSRCEQIVNELSQQKEHLSTEDFAAAQALLLPFTVVKGVVHELVISIPWASLDSTPVRVAARGVEVTLGPLRTKPYDAKEEVSREEVIKQTRLRSFEREREEIYSASGGAGGSSSSGSASSSFSAGASASPASPRSATRAPGATASLFSSLSFVERIIESAIQNAQLTVTDISFRYVFDYDSLHSSCAAALSVWVGRVTVVATNEAFENQFVTDFSRARFKVVTAEDVALFVHCHRCAPAGGPSPSVSTSSSAQALASAETQESFAAQWAVTEQVLAMDECTALLRLAVPQVGKGGKLLPADPSDITVSPRRVNVRLSFGSLRLLVYLLKAFTEGLNGAPFRKHLYWLLPTAPRAPGEPVAPLARRRWNFALACVLDSVRQGQSAVVQHQHKSERTTLAQRVVLYGRVRRQYCGLWKRQVQVEWLPPLDRAESIELSQLEKTLPLDHVVFFRCLAYAEIAQERRLRARQRFYINNVHGTATAEGSATPSGDSSSESKERRSWWKLWGNSNDKGGSSASAAAQSPPPPPPSATSTTRKGSENIVGDVFRREWHVGCRYVVNRLMLDPSSQRAARTVRPQLSVVVPTAAPSPENVGQEGARLILKVRCKTLQLELFPVYHGAAGSLAGPPPGTRVLFLQHLQQRLVARVDSFEFYMDNSRERTENRSSLSVYAGSVFVGFKGRMNTPLLQSMERYLQRGKEDCFVLKRNATKTRLAVTVCPLLLVVRPTQELLWWATECTEFASQLLTEVLPGVQPRKNNSTTSALSTLLSLGGSEARGEEERGLPLAIDFSAGGLDVVMPLFSDDINESDLQVVPRSSMSTAASHASGSLDTVERGGSAADRGAVGPLLVPETSGALTFSRAAGSTALGGGEYLDDFGGGSGSTAPDDGGPKLMTEETLAMNSISGSFSSVTSRSYLMGKACLILSVPTIQGGSVRGKEKRFRGSGEEYYFRAGDGSENETVRIFCQLGRAESISDFLSVSSVELLMNPEEVCVELNGGVDITVEALALALVNDEVLKPVSLFTFVNHELTSQLEERFRCCKTDDWAVEGADSIRIGESVTGGLTSAYRRQIVGHFFRALRAEEEERRRAVVQQAMPTKKAAAESASASASVDTNNSNDNVGAQTSRASSQPAGTMQPPPRFVICCSHFNAVLRDFNHSDVVSVEMIAPTSSYTRRDQLSHYFSAFSEAPHALEVMWRPYHRTEGAVQSTGSEEVVLSHNVVCLATDFSILTAVGKRLLSIDHLSAELDTLRSFSVVVESVEVAAVSPAEWVFIAQHVRACVQTFEPFRSKAAASAPSPTSVHPESRPAPRFLLPPIELRVHTVDASVVFYPSLELLRTQFHDTVVKIVPYADYYGIAARTVLHSAERLVSGYAFDMDEDDEFTSFTIATKSVSLRDRRPQPTTISVTLQVPFHPPASSSVLSSGQPLPVPQNATCDVSAEGGCFVLYGPFLKQIGSTVRRFQTALTSLKDSFEHQHGYTSTKESDWLGDTRASAAPREKRGAPPPPPMTISGRVSNIEVLLAAHQSLPVSFADLSSYFYVSVDSIDISDEWRAKSAAGARSLFGSVASSISRPNDGRRVVSLTISGVHTAADDMGTIVPLARSVKVDLEMNVLSVPAEIASRLPRHGAHQNEPSEATGKPLTVTITFPDENAGASGDSLHQQQQQQQPQQHQQPPRPVLDATLTLSRLSVLMESVLLNLQKGEPSALPPKASGSSTPYGGCAGAANAADATTALPPPPVPVCIHVHVPYSRISLSAAHVLGQTNGSGDDRMFEACVPKGVRVFSGLSLHGEGTAVHHVEIPSIELHDTVASPYLTGEARPTLLRIRDVDVFVSKAVTTTVLSPAHTFAGPSSTSSLSLPSLPGHVSEALLTNKSFESHRLCTVKTTTRVTTKETQIFVDSVEPWCILKEGLLSPTLTHSLTLSVPDDPLPRSVSAALSQRSGTPSGAAACASGQLQLVEQKHVECVLSNTTVLVSRSTSVSVPSVSVSAALNADSSSRVRVAVQEGLTVKSQDGPQGSVSLVEIKGGGNHDASPLCVEIDVPSTAPGPKYEHRILYDVAPILPPQPRVSVTLSTVGVALHVVPLAALLEFAVSNRVFLSRLLKSHPRVPLSENTVCFPEKKVPSLRLELNMFRLVAPSVLLDPQNSFPYWNEVELEGVLVSSELSFTTLPIGEASQFSRARVANTVVNASIAATRLLCRSYSATEEGFFPIEFPALKVRGVLSSPVNTYFEVPADRADRPEAVRVAASGSVGSGEEEEDEETFFSESENVKLSLAGDANGLLYCFLSPKDTAVVITDINDASWFVGFLRKDPRDRVQPLMVSPAHIRCVGTAALLYGSEIQERFIPLLARKTSSATGKSSSATPTPTSTPPSSPPPATQAAARPVATSIVVSLDNFSVRLMESGSSVEPRNLVTEFHVVDPLEVLVTLEPQCHNGTHVRGKCHLTGGFMLTDHNNMRILYREQDTVESSGDSPLGNAERPSGLAVKADADPDTGTTTVTFFVSDLSVNITSTTIDYVLQLRDFAERCVLQEVDTLRHLKKRLDTRRSAAVASVAQTTGSTAATSSTSALGTAGKTVLLLYASIRSVYLNISNIAVVSVEDIDVELDMLKKRKQGLPVTFKVNRMTLRPFVRSESPLIVLGSMSVELGPGKTNVHLDSALVRVYNTFFYLRTFAVVRELVQYVGSQIKPWRRAEDNFRMDTWVTLGGIRLCLYSGVHYRSEGGAERDDDSRRGITGYAEISFPEVSVRVVDSVNARKITVDTEEGRVSQHNSGVHGTSHVVGQNLGFSLSYACERGNTPSHVVALRLTETTLYIPNGETLSNFIEAMSQTLFPLANLSKQQQQQQQQQRAASVAAKMGRSSVVPPSFPASYPLPSAQWVQLPPNRNDVSGAVSAAAATAGSNTAGEESPLPTSHHGQFIRLTLFIPLFSLNVCRVNELGGVRSPILFGASFHHVSGEFTSNDTSRVALFQIVRISHVIEPHIQHGFVSATAPADTHGDPSMAVALYARYETLFLSKGEAMSDGKPLLKKTFTGRLHGASLVFSPTLVRVCVQNVLHPVQRSISRTRELPLSSTEEIACGGGAGIPAALSRENSGVVRVFKITESCYLKEDLFLGYHSRVVFCRAKRRADADPLSPLSGEQNVIVIRGLQNAEVYLAMVNHPTGGVDPPIVIEEGLTVRFEGAPVILTDPLFTELNDYVSLGSRALLVAKHTRVSDSVPASSASAAAALQRAVASEQSRTEEDEEVGTIHNTFSVDLLVQLEVSLTSQLQTMSAGLELLGEFNQVHRFEAPMSLVGASSSATEAKRFVDESGTFQLKGITVQCNGGPLTAIDSPIVLYIQHGKAATTAAAEAGNTKSHSATITTTTTTATMPSGNRKSGSTRLQAIIPPTRLFISLGHLKMLTEFISDSRRESALMPSSSSTTRNDDEADGNGCAVVPSEDSNRREWGDDEEGNVGEGFHTLASFASLSQHNYRSKKRSAFYQATGTSASSSFASSAAPQIEVSVTSPSVEVVITNAFFKPEVKVELSDSLLQAQYDRRLTWVDCSFASTVTVKDQLSLYEDQSITPTGSTGSTAVLSPSPRVLFSANPEAVVKLSRYPLGGVSLGLSASCPLLEVSLPLPSVLSALQFNFAQQTSSNYTFRNLTGLFVIIYLGGGTSGTSFTRLISLYHGDSVSVDWLSHLGTHTRILLSAEAVPDVNKASQLFVKATPVNFSSLSASLPLRFAVKDAPHILLNAVIRVDDAVREVLLTSPVHFVSKLRCAEGAEVSLPFQKVVGGGGGDPVYLPFTTLQAPFEMSVGARTAVLASPLLSLQSLISAFVMLPAASGERAKSQENVFGSHAVLADSSTLVLPLLFTSPDAPRVPDSVMRLCLRKSVLASELRVGRRDRNAMPQMSVAVELIATLTVANYCGADLRVAVLTSNTKDAPASTQFISSDWIPFESAFEWFPKSADELHQTPHLLFTIRFPSATTKEEEGRALELHSVEALSAARPGQHYVTLRSRDQSAVSVAASVHVSPLGSIRVMALNAVENKLPFSVRVLKGGDDPARCEGALVGLGQDHCTLQTGRRHPLFATAPSTSKKVVGTIRVSTVDAKAKPTIAFSPQTLSVPRLLKCEEPHCVKLFMVCKEQTAEAPAFDDVAENDSGNAGAESWRSILPVVALKSLWVLTNDHDTYSLRVHFVDRGRQYDILIPPKKSEDLVSFGACFKDSGDPEIRLRYQQSATLIPGDSTTTDDDDGFIESPSLKLATLCATGTPLAFKHVFRSAATTCAAGHWRDLLVNTRVPEHHGDELTSEVFACMTLETAMREEQYFITCTLATEDEIPLVIENRTYHNVQCNIVMDGLSAISSTEQLPRGYLVAPLRDCKMCWDVALIENPVLKLSVYPSLSMTLNRDAAFGTGGDRTGRGGTTTVDVVKAMAAKEAIKIGDFFAFVFFDFALQRYFITVMDSRALESRIVFQPSFIGHIQVFVQEVRVFVAAIAVPQKENQLEKTLVGTTAKKGGGFNGHGGVSLLSEAAGGDDVALLGALKQKEIDIVFIAAQCLNLTACFNERRILVGGDLGTLTVMDCTSPAPKHAVIFRMAPQAPSSPQAGGVRKISAGGTESIAGGSDGVGGVGKASSALLPCISFTADSQWQYNRYVRQSRHRSVTGSPRSTESEKRRAERRAAEEAKKNVIVPMDSFSLRIGTMQLFLDDSFLFTARQVTENLRRSWRPIPAHPVSSGSKQHPREERKHKRRYVFDLYLRKAEISEIQVIVTLSRRPDNRFNPFEGLPTLVGIAVPSIDAAPVTVKALRLGGLHLRNASLAEALFSTFTSQYRNQILLQVYKLLGSLEVLGNPLALVGGWGRGLRSLVASTVIDLDPWEGARSFMKNSASSTLHSVGLLSSVGGRTIAAFSVDRDYWLEQEREAASSSFFADVAQGLAGGVRGVVTQPLHGAQQGGLSGFIAGVASGVVGLVSRPVAGLLYGVSGTAEFYAKSLSLAFERDLLDSKLYLRLNRNFAPASSSDPLNTAQQKQRQQLRPSASLSPSTGFLSPAGYDQLVEEVSAKNMFDSVAAKYLLERMGPHNFALYVEFDSFLRYTSPEEFFSYIGIALNRVVMQELQRTAVLMPGASSKRSRSAEELEAERGARERGANIKQTLGVAAVLQYMPLQHVFLVCSVREVQQIMTPEDFQMKCGPVLLRAVLRAANGLLCLSE